MIVLTRGERFKDSRIIHNIHGKQTMAEVAAATGVSQSCISDLENDKRRNVGAEDIKKLAKHYGVSADYLLELSDTPSIDLDIKAICGYTGLSDTAVKRLNYSNQQAKQEATMETFHTVISGQSVIELIDKLTSSSHVFFIADSFRKLSQKKGLDAAIDHGLIPGDAGYETLNIVNDLSYARFELSNRFMLFAEEATNADKE